MICYFRVITSSTLFSLQGNEVKQKVPEEKIKEFKFIVQLYLDFMQKEKVNLATAPFDCFLLFQLNPLPFQMKKLQKLRQNQFNMPVYKSYDEILKTIKENQVGSGLSKTKMLGFKFTVTFIVKSSRSQ